MSAPCFNILTQKELTIDLSRPAIQNLIEALHQFGWEREYIDANVQCELDNFRNTLLNLLERSEPKPENSDLVGD